MTTAPLLELYVPETQESITSRGRVTRKRPVGPQLPPMQLEEELGALRRVKLYQASQPIADLDDAYDRLSKDSMDMAANAFVGFMSLQNAEDLCDHELLKVSTQHLETAINAGKITPRVRFTLTVKPELTLKYYPEPLNFQNWYLLGRTYLQLQEVPKAYEALQQAVYREGRCPSIWITVARLFYLVNQYRDALDGISRAIELNPSLYEPWYNLGVLVGVPRVGSH